MKRFWLQTLSLLLLATFQFSFVNMAFSPAWVAPNILVAISIIWILRKDFRSVIGRIIILGLLFDLVSGGSLGVTSVLLLWFTYITSFLSKRFLVEHSGSGFILAGLLVGVFSIISILLERLFSYTSQGGQSMITVDWFGTFLPYMPAIFVINLCSFLLLVFLFARFTTQPFSDRLDPLFRG